MRVQKRTSPNPAGRPKSIENPVRVNITVSASQAAHIRAAAGGINAYVRVLIERDMATKK